MPKVSFMPPKGYAAPEGVGPGETFSELCEFRMEKGGVTLVKMGDVPMEADKQGKPDYSDEATNMANAMSQPQDQQQAATM